MPQGLKRFLKRVQESDDSVKKRYLLIFSIIAMAIVVSLWVMYLKEASTPKTVDQHSNSIQKIFSAIFQWGKDLIFKIKEGRIINIER